MADKNDVSFRLRLLGAAAMAKELAKGGTAFKELGTDAQKAGEKAAGASRGMGLFEKRTKETARGAKEAHLSVHKLVGGLAGVGVGFEALSQGRESINVTKELAEATLNLNAIQGLSTQSASQWATVAQVKGIATTRLASAFNILSRNINMARKQHDGYTGNLAKASRVDEQRTRIQQSFSARLAALGTSAHDAVRRQILATQEQEALDRVTQNAQTRRQGLLAKGAGTQAAAFRKLGITQADLRASQRDLGPLMEKLAERFTAMHGGSEKAYLGLQLFGRGAQKILPLFKEGNESLATNLKWAKQYGVAMGGETPEQLRKFLVAQDKAKYATIGMQVAFGTYLAPALTKIMTAWPRLVLSIRRGHGAWADIRDVLMAVTGAGHAVIGVFDRSRLATRLLVYGLTALGVAWGVEKVLKWNRAIRESILVTKLLGRTAVTTAAEEAAASPAGKTGAIAAGSRFGTILGGAAKAAIIPLVIEGVSQAYQQAIGLLPNGWAKNALAHEAGRSPFKQLAGGPVGPLLFPESTATGPGDVLPSARGMHWAARGNRWVLVPNAPRPSRPPVHAHAGSTAPLHVHVHVDGKQVGEVVIRDRLRREARR